MVINCHETCFVVCSSLSDSHAPEAEEEDISDIHVSCVECSARV